MAANKFATWVYRKAKRSKMVVILVYAVLEWILLALLLVNSILSYLTYKFSSYFGLNMPCLFCSRLENLFDGDKGEGSGACYRRFLCEDHCSEVSLLGYCTNHRKLAEASEMCVDCYSSRPSPFGLKHTMDTTDHPVPPLFSLINSEGNGDDALKDHRCSCCRVPLESGFYSLDSFHLRNKPQLQPDNPINQMETTKERADAEHDSDSTRHTCLQAISHRYQAHGSEDRIVPVESINSATLDDVDSVTSQKVTDPFHDLITAFGNNEVLTSSLFNKQNVDDSVVLLKPLADEETQASPNDAKTYYETDTEVTIGSEICDDELSDQSLLAKAPIPSSVCQVDSFIKFQDKSQDHEGCHHDQLTDGGANPEVSSFLCRPKLIEHTQHQQSRTAKYLTLNSNTSNGRQLLDARFLLALIWSISVLDGCVASENGSADNGKATVEVSEGRESCDQVNNDAHQLQVEDSPLLDQLDNDDPEEVNAMTDKEPAATETNVPTATWNNQIDEDTHQQEHLELVNSQGDVSRRNDDENDELQVINRVPSNQDQCGLCQNRDIFPVTTEQMNGTAIETSRISSEFGPLEAIRNGVNHESSACLEHYEVEEERTPDTPNYIEGVYNMLKRSMYEKREMGTESMDGSIASEVDACEPSTVDQLKATLRAERRALGALYAELEEERSASAVAANQTMAMINRLQEEKAAMQMEALQYQRMMDEQSEYDQEALQILNDIIVKKDKEKQELEKELEIYREKVMFYERKEKRTKSLQANGVSTIISTVSSSEEDSNDLSVGPTEGEQSSHELTEHKHKKSLDETLADFDEERISIVKILNALEDDMFKKNIDGYDDADQDSENLPFEAAWKRKWCGMEEDFEYAYERLQALELDSEILKGSINSLRNGEEGQ